MQMEAQLSGQNWVSLRGQKLRKYFVTSIASLNLKCLHELFRLVKISLKKKAHPTSLILEENTEKKTVTCWENFSHILTTTTMNPWTKLSLLAGQQQVNNR